MTLDELREAYPEWDIEERWSTVNSGPDSRSYLASKDDVTVTGFSVADLARALRQTAGER